MRKLAFLVLLAGCGALSDKSAAQLRQEYGDAAKEAAPFLPVPFNYVLAAAGTLLAGWGTHKTARHIKKRKLARTLPMEKPT